jgi:hypothetical protein
MCREHGSHECVAEEGGEGGPVEARVGGSVEGAHQRAIRRRVARDRGLAVAAAVVQVLGQVREV